MFGLTTGGRAANKPHCAVILLEDGEILGLLARIFVELLNWKTKFYFN